MLSAGRVMRMPGRKFRGAAGFRGRQRGSYSMQRRENSGAWQALAGGSEGATACSGEKIPGCGGLQRAAAGEHKFHSG